MGHRLERRLQPGKGRRVGLVALPQGGAHAAQHGRELPTVQGDVLHEQCHALWQRLMVM